MLYLGRPLREVEKKLMSQKIQYVIKYIVPPPKKQNLFPLDEGNFYVLRIKKLTAQSWELLVAARVRKEV